MYGLLFVRSHCVRWLHIPCSAMLSYTPCTHSTHIAQRGILCVLFSCVPTKRKKTELRICGVRKQHTHKHTRIQHAILIIPPAREADKKCDIVRQTEEQWREEVKREPYRWPQEPGGGPGSARRNERENSVFAFPYSIQHRWIRYTFCIYIIWSAMCNQFCRTEPFHWTDCVSVFQMAQLYSYMAPQRALARSRLAQ